ncbi:MAG: exopolysaccharide Pel transporter PelG, partial [Armatimonadetes bacterium]|nr:exopolysaccharide Pel transporter PelG [Armatimonadota bacterium]
MAGIGFKLRTFVAEGTLMGILKGYLYSAVISSGPWIITVCTLAAISLMGGHEKHFEVAILYVYAFSLIVTGLFQFIVTRFLADRLYAEDLEVFLPTFMAVSLVVSLFQAVTGILAFGAMETSLLFRILAVVLYIVVSNLWLSLIFLGVVRAYQTIVWAFVIGSLISFATAFLLGKDFGGEGYIFGFTLGQFAIYVTLMYVMFTEFEAKRVFDFSFLGYFKVYPALAYLGLVFYMGVWADKFLFWWSDRGTVIVAPIFRASLEYDTAGFIAQLSVLPALALFMVKVETGFYEKYRDFYGGITAKLSFQDIETKKREIVENLKSGFGDFLRVQGLTTFFLVVFAPQFFYFLWLSDAGYALLQIHLVAAFWLTGLLLAMIILLYFEYYPQAIISAGVFLGSNLLFTQVGLRWRAFDGYGYLLACLCGFLVAAWFVARGLALLEFVTFSKQ